MAEYRLQGLIDPGLHLVAPAIPDVAVSGASRNCPMCGARRTPWEDPDIMAAKPKPETTDEAREQARRALQTSMDTRQ
ncbi:hypothetical protein [Phytohabitans rumicis]|uniref:Uncharacterized protein n=1 Tax=Phytohabitans rumicis TaxID=1076125 RepID=A0A6V8L2S9_9ACTN|nr:hypothetical protein [Phytohabitans rumicis]GFJ88949.1 hypothetical protein Prum_025910 [Phytohabitans rumicis]